uniref:G-protein coupled receptors family 1 profile domain-containing protein n=1 Tax=Panagrolaimus sp. JU765 TaxID=591449 RepID=A0AC34RE06_9BILA
MQMQEIIRHGSPSGNWTEVDCGWFDEVADIQNRIYWRHKGAGNIIFLYLSDSSSDGVLHSELVLAIRGLVVPNPGLVAGRQHVRVLLDLGIDRLGSGIADALSSPMEIPIKSAIGVLSRAPLVCYLVVWLTALLVAAPYFFAVSAEDAQLDPWSAKHTDEILKICEKQKPQICLERTWHRLPFSRRTYTLTVLAIQYILPLMALGFAYSQIGSTIRRRVKHTTTVDQQRKHILIQRNRRAVLLLLLLVLIYGTAWLPINAYNVLNVLDVIEFSQSKYIICHLIGMASACLNPIMYGLINEAFRNAFLAMLRPIFRPCTKFIPVSPQLPTNTTFSYTLNRKDSPRKQDSALHSFKSNGNENTQISEPLVVEASDDQFC